ncbi:hypothetical protein H8E77_12335 [bacterium]|nr:hypothetical protein [bacterium]
MKTDKEILRPIIDEYLEIANDAIQDERKELWARHNALMPTKKIPISVYYEGMPAQHWNLMFGENYLQCRDSMARSFEFNLKRQIWMERNVPDDHIKWTAVWINAASRSIRNWGVSMGWKRPQESLGAGQVTPPFADKIGISQLTMPEVEVDERETTELKEKAEELVERRLKVFVSYPDMGFNPFDILIRMRGMDNLFIDMYDRPEVVHELMSFIEEALVGSYKKREERGWINVSPFDDSKYQAVGFRVNCAYLAEDFRHRKPNLADEWIYVSDQTSEGLSPKQYEEFVHRYHIRMAEFFTRKTVYHHACENTDSRIDIIRNLPNLRRYHVSPWTNIELAREKLQDKFVLEVHAHSSNVAMAYTRKEMREELKHYIDVAGDVNIDLNLSDIHSINGRPDVLREWSEVAQELADKNLS